MRNIKITIAYDGTRYNGWQKQENTDNTIQGKIETLLSRMTGENVEIHGSGRTDAGVHAKGQVFHFHTKCNWSSEKITEYMTEFLPMDIAVIEVREENLRFHSRLNVKSKTYCYRIWNNKIPHVFERKYSYHETEGLNLEKMEQAAAYLIGEHDFKSFCSNKRMKKSTVRRIDSVTFEKQGSMMEIRYRGSGFLYNMVRILTGTLIEIGKGQRKPEDMELIMAACDRERAGFTAPPQGLFLERVEY